MTPHGHHIVLDRHVHRGQGGHVLGVVGREKMRVDRQRNRSGPMASNPARNDDERDWHDGAAVLRGHDSVEAEAVQAEGHDPDDPALRAALDLVRWELDLLAFHGLAY